MRIDRNQLKNIDEVRYLSTENTWRYRTIMRMMYKQYDKMKYWLFKEDIYELMRQYDDFNDYTLEQLKADLDQLTQWGNLTAIADTTKVKTVEEFKNRAFRYQLSPYAIEIERMLMALEHMQIENTATLEQALIERFLELLRQYKPMMHQEPKKIYEWWKALYTAFRELNQNYQDYISTFYSPKTEELMRTTAFLVFKEAFVKYLRDFIRGLQVITISIREVFETMEEDAIESLLTQVLIYEQSIVNVQLTIDAEEYLDINRGRFVSMREWFVSTPSHVCLVDKLIDNTNEIIRKLTRFAAQIADKRTNNINRKDEYAKMAAIFKATETIEDAHKLASMLFGSCGTCHVLAKETRQTENINSSIFEEAPTHILTKPRVRTFREKTIKNPIIDKAALKEEKMRILLEKRRRESDQIEKFIANNQIDFKDLGKISVWERKLLLKWLTKGRTSKQKWHQTESGKWFQVCLQEPTEQIVLQCEDGMFKMPYYKMYFKGDEA